MDIFFETTKGKKYQKSSLEKTAKDIAKRAGSKVKATVHVYRKTFASSMFLKTGNILLVSKLLGHASTETTSRYYLIDDLEAMKHEVLRTA